MLLKDIHKYILCTWTYKLILLKITLIKTSEELNTILKVIKKSLVEVIVSRKELEKTDLKNHLTSSQRGSIVSQMPALRLFLRCLGANTGKKHVSAQFSTCSLLFISSLLCWEWQCYQKQWLPSDWEAIVSIRPAFIFLKLISHKSLIS